MTSLSATNLYDKDFYAWTQETLQALRAKDTKRLDFEHLAEEIEDMGAKEKSALGSRLRVLLMHLLKWEYQPSHRSKSWEITIDQQRDHLKDLLDFNPSLKPKVSGFLALAYTRAKRDFHKETGIVQTTLPENCPYTLADILSTEYYPA